MNLFQLSNDLYFIKTQENKEKDLIIKKDIFPG
jgi:hypothetical protein